MSTKNIKYSLLLLSLLCLVVINVKAQTPRNVAWIHGLKGSSSSWEHYNDIFDNELNINSTRQTYNTDLGIAYAANQVKNSIDAAFGQESTNPDNLAISHSMGGLMVRYVDSNTPSNAKRFGGYITTTSPIYGAPIANSILNGSVNNVAQNATAKLTAGPVAQLFGLPWNIIANLATNELSSYISVDNLIEEQIGSATTVNDLRVGSPTINQINAYDTNNSIPRISIWAEENSPVHWRMFSSSKYNYNDQTLVNYVSTARSVYNGFYIGNTSLAITCVALGFWNPYCWGVAANATYRAVQWKKGRDWIDNSETTWCSLIKTTRLEQQTYWVEEWIPCDYPPIERSIDPDCGEWIWVQHTHWVMVNYPSDGLLPKYTQIMLDNPTPNNVYHVTGANHIEVRNMGNSPQGDLTKIQFDNIFHYRGEYDFFTTN